MSSDHADLSSLVGHRFPGGDFVIAPYEDWLLRDVLGAPTGDGELAHPLWAFVAPQQSMGVSVDDIFRLCGSAAEDGPMLGDTEIDIRRPLRLSERYAVSGEIVSAVRKQGRQAGTFDLVHFTATTRSDAGDLVARLTNSFILPRSSS